MINMMAIFFSKLQLVKMFTLWIKYPGYTIKCHNRNSESKSLIPLCTYAVFFAHLYVLTH